MAFLTGINLLSLLLAAAAFFFFIAGVRALRLGSKTIYFRHRRQRVLAGWWMTGASLLLMLITALTFRAWNPLFSTQASPTPVSSATAVPATPSRTSSPEPTSTRTLTPTASSTPTPHLPLSLEIMVVSSVTPQATAIIRDIRFTERLVGMLPVGNRAEWSNPLQRMYASFEYSHMTYGAQFTALWFRNGELIYFESGPWSSGGHGRGYSKWEPAPHEWHAGQYEVQFFVGTEWKATGYFSLSGEPLTPTFTPTPSMTRTPSPTLTPSPVPSETPIPTSTK
jgi:hypothetical protein